MSVELALNASPAIAGPITDPARPDVGEALLQYGRRFWYAMRRCWWSSYWRLQVDGAAHVPRRGPVLLCANHASHLDAPALLAALPREVALRASTAAAKDAFADYRWRKIVSRLVTNALPIEREAGFSRGLRELEAVLAERRPLILFPEGKRSTDGSLVEFKLGAAMLSLRTGAPIVPIRIAGADASLPRGAYFPRPGEVRVRFGEPIDPQPLRRAVAEQRRAKRDAYERLTDEVKAAVVAMAVAPSPRPQPVRHAA